MPKQTNFYERLGVLESASPDEILKAYRTVARRLHPDVNKEAGATERFLNIKEAYEVLSDPERRANYSPSTPSFPPKPKIQTVSINTHYSRASIPPLDEPQLIYALLELDILPEVNLPEEPAHPINIALILDTSTSMNGSRLSVVKATAIELLRQLRAQDTVAIIAFDDKAEVVIPSNRYPDSRKIEGRIHTLRASGGTEIYQGLDAGFQAIRQNSRPATVDHIILITDGRTYGDEDKCIQLAQEAADMGVGISSLGIGSEWHDALLDQLATITGGSCIFVQKPADIKHLVKQKIKSFEQAYTKDIQLNIQTGPGITLHYAFQTLPNAGVLSTSAPLHLGHLPRNKQLHLLLEFLVDPVPNEIDHILVADGEFNFEIPAKSSTTYRCAFTLTRPSQSLHMQPPNSKLVDALSRLTLYRMQESAQNELLAGQYDQATRRLQNMASHLLAKGEKELANTVLAEAQHIQTSRNLSAAGQKQIKYGSRALFLNPGKEKDRKL